MKKIKNILKVAKAFWDKGGEQSKAKKAEKKLNKSKLPPQYRWHKLGRILFWTLFVLMFLFFTLAFFGNNGESDKKNIEAPKQNRATMQQSVEFAQEFADKYLTIKGDSKALEKRSEDLKKYMVDGLESSGGLEIDEQSGNETKVKSLDLKNVEESGEDKAQITFKANIEQTTYKTETVEKEVKDGNKKKKVKEKVDKPQTKEATKYIVIPVYYENSAYAVYQYPHFTKVDEQAKVKYQKPEYKYAYQDKKGVERFLDTFFETYASQKEDKINYMLVNDKVKVSTLEGGMSYKSISNINAGKVSESAEDIKVQARVKFEDEVGITYTTDYDITLVKEDEKYLIKEFNAEK
ncbi:conjugal transfer protein [Staphylococcus agnetis]|uniref:conjugal transfer protein n=1 Tax=Staphylococcus agnetis TaxID=985762 RepID=UPI00208FC9C6|nr:conjugal transfer protein [Staphylococcus agnetis]MCO4353539.1 conjugal transfer protein [Staphylococcus agnetis]